MPVIRVEDYVDLYRMRSQSADLHDLALRDGRRALTEFVNEQILNHLTPGPADVLVDIGCGDGCLLRMAIHAASRIGTVGSNEERERLEKELPDVEVKVAAMGELPLPSAVATKVVCNATLFYLQSQEEVSQALKEIARIAQKDAVIWIGEIPAVDECVKYKVYSGKSIAGLLWFLLRRHSLRAFLGMCRKLVQAKFGREVVILNSARIYYSSPADFVILAEKCGLSMDRFFKHRELDSQGKVVDSEHRFDYVFRKISAV